MGGGFGGKEDMTVEPFLALLTWATRRPVRMIWDRQESLAASTKRHPMVMRYTTGATSDGRLTGQKIEIIGDAGAYPYLSPRIVFAAAVLACGPYGVADVDIRSLAVFTNNVPTSAFRGFGAMQVTFAYESQMDRLAAAASHRAGRAASSELPVEGRCDPDRRDAADRGRRRRDTGSSAGPARGAPVAVSAAQGRRSWIRVQHAAVRQDHLVPLTGRRPG